MTKSNSSILHWVLLFCGVLWVAPTAADSAAYYETIDALHARYADEVTAHRKYGTYAERALEEGYPGIAHLFRALAASEAVHARNFARLLHELGEEPRRPEVNVATSTTREHLQQAATVEAEEIDREYPKILDGIRDENNTETIRFIAYAWKAEQQHRDLIIKIKQAASWFFGSLVSKIEGTPTRYYVCRVCGSTVTARPTGQCPICDHTSSDSAEVPGFGGAPASREKG